MRGCGPDQAREEAPGDVWWSSFSGPVNIGPVLRAFIGVSTYLHEVERLLRQRGVISRRDHPELSGTLDRLLRQGDLRAVLPGIYSEPDRIGQFSTRVLAAMVDSPDAVLIDGAAARVSFWADLPVREVACAVPGKRVSPPGFRFVRRTVPPELVVNGRGLRFTAPALTAIDLCDTLGGEPIDQALRTRTATLEQLHQAFSLSPSRGGNATRRMLLLDSRDEPWSEAERLFHRLLRAAGIVDWKSNRGMVLDGLTYYIDVAFERVRLAIEIDGRLHETDANIFENDRWRQNALVLDGWRVIRFTWKMLTEHPEMVIAVVRQALAG